MRTNICCKRSNALGWASGVAQHIATVAGLAGDERSLWRIFANHVAELDQSASLATPEWLVLDEIYLLHKSRAVLTNVGPRTLVDMLGNRYCQPTPMRLDGRPLCAAKTAS